LQRLGRLLRQCGGAIRLLPPRVRPAEGTVIPASASAVVLRLIAPPILGRWRWRGRLRDSTATPITGQESRDTPPQTGAHKENEHNGQHDERRSTPPARGARALRLGGRRSLSSTHRRTVRVRVMLALRLRVV